MGFARVVVWVRVWLMSCPKDQGQSKWSVTEVEYPSLLRGQSPDHPLIKEFNDRVGWYRTLVLPSKVVLLTRYGGSCLVSLGSPREAP